MDDPWIPVVDQGLVNLRTVFTNLELQALVGTPIQKISVQKLLLAIVQAAYTPLDDADWHQCDTRELARYCLDYLDKWHNAFELYGEHPFLQMPQIKQAKQTSYGAVLPEVSTNNTSVLTHIQMGTSLTDPEKALLLVCLMSYALGGKKVDNSVVLAQYYSGKTSSNGNPGPALAGTGLLHNFWQGNCLIETLKLNWLTRQDMQQSGMFPGGVGRPPWEKMPESEDCETARELKTSLMGRLVPLCRFVLLAENGLHYSEGIAHPNYKEGVVDPSVAVSFANKRPKVLWTDPEKRPWRELTALLSFIEDRQTKGYEILQLQTSLARVRQSTEVFGLWSGGLKVTNKAGEQYPAGNDDFVDSIVWLDSDALGENWFACLKEEMQKLNKVQQTLYTCIKKYYQAQCYNGTSLAQKATQLFWQQCENDFQQLVNICEPGEENQAARNQLRLRFYGYASQLYHQYCPSNTARRMSLWAEYLPSFAQFPNKEAL